MRNTFQGPTSVSQQHRKKGVTYQAANGGEIANKGEFDVAYRLCSDKKEYHTKVATFQNAEVGMPIFSLNGLAKEKHRIILDEDAGLLIHKPTGIKYPFVAAAGVYFILMRVPRSYMQPTNDSKPKGCFQRHGVHA